MFVRSLIGLAFTAGLLAAQNAPPAADKAAPPTAAGPYVVAAGTKLPLSLINSVSTKHTESGDRVYLDRKSVV
jgi:hypothetical protein